MTGVIDLHQGRPVWAADSYSDGNEGGRHDGDEDACAARAEPVARAHDCARPIERALRPPRSAPDLARARAAAIAPLLAHVGTARHRRADEPADARDLPRGGARLS